MIRKLNIYIEKMEILRSSGESNCEYTRGYGRADVDVVIKPHGKKMIYTRNIELTSEQALKILALAQKVIEQAGQPKLDRESFLKAMTDPAGKTEEEYLKLINDRVKWITEHGEAK